MRHKHSHDREADPVVQIADYLGVPGLTYCRDFLDEREQAAALAAIDQGQWDTSLKRRVQHFGHRYDYKARTVDPTTFLGELPAFAQRVTRRLVDSGLMPAVPDQLIVNEYLPGQGISLHVDCIPCFGGSIATISLSSAYVMDLVDTESDETRQLRLQLGSCLVFAGEARYRWKHGIRARKSDDGVQRCRRVSMTFRTVVK